MSPRVPPRFVRAVVLPKRVLTPSRKIKIREFKKFCKVSPTDHGNTGSEVWKLSLLDFMGEREILTIDDLNRWIQQSYNHWIITDDPPCDAPGRSAGMEYRNDDHLYNGANADTWPMHPGTVGDTIPNYSPIRNATESNQPMTSNNLNTVYYIEHENQPGCSTNVGYPNGTEEMSGTYMPSTAWQEKTYQQTVPPRANVQIIRTNGANVSSTNPSMDLENDDNLYSEEVLAGLTEMTKHLAPLNKLCGRVAVVHTQLRPIIDRMINTVLRAQHRCLTVMQYKEARAAKAARIQKIKTERLNGQGQETTGNQLDGEGFVAVGEVDISG